MTGYGSSGSLRGSLNKVPEVTIFFWIINVLSTTVGDTFAGFLGTTLGFGLTRTTMAMTTVLAGVLVIQFRAERYVPALYWLVVVLVGIVGALISDNLTELFDVALPTSTVVFAVLLTATFGAWYVKERTLSITAVDTPAREGFYWLAALFTFALGTAAGDLASEALALGYGPAVFSCALALLGIWTAHRCLGLGTIAAFWAAYVLTRPFGASLRDLLTQPPDAGGLGAGPLLTSLLFLAVTFAVVAHLSVTGRNHDAPASTTRTSWSC
jgi:uncharacterized membrane-anchored protein